MSRDRYFIALLPPQNIQSEIQEIQQHFEVTYHLRRKANSPPHITIQPPFEWEAENLILLTKTLAEFSQNQPSVSISLAGFAAFKPRVIFIQPLKTPELMQLQQSLKIHLETTLGIVKQEPPGRSFSPHITVAFCNPKKSDFKRAWPEAKAREFTTNFSISQLTLLIYKNRYWHICQEFELNF
jgi:2'-5' RNA ligase